MTPTSSHATDRADCQIQDDGWCTSALCLPSPNFNQRPMGVEVSLIVIHNISLPLGEYGGGYIADLFLNQLDCNAHSSFASLQSLQVSSHFLIQRDGSLLQFVSTLDRAWHAGVSSFQGRDGCNDFSIGIELEGTDDTRFEAAQYQTLAKLSRALLIRFPISFVVGHQDVAPGRKTDPGPFFEWKNYQELLTGNDINQNRLVLTSRLPSFPFVI